MRRNATVFSLVAICLVGLSGCNTSGKKSAKTQAASTYQDPYVEAAMNTSYNERPAENMLSSQTTMPTTQPSIDYGNSAYQAVETTPLDSAADYGVRVHTVAKGDTLYSLARRYYNDQARWKEIYSANRDNISNPNMVRVGQQIVIP